MSFAKTLLYSFAFAIFAFLFTSCSDDTNSPGRTTSGTVLIGLEETEEGEIFLSEMTVSKSDASVNRLISLGDPYYYPESFNKESKIEGDKLYMYNILPDYEHKLVIYDIKTGAIDTLPQASTSHDNTWSTYSNRFDVKNGNCYYIMGETDGRYSDWAGSYICRYNVTTGEFIAMGNPDDFALGQPEKKSDTETASWSAVFASEDGTSCYGSMLAWGVDDGVNHYDYNIPFKYTPSNTQEPLERIGDETTGICGATKDRSYLYLNSTVVNTQTGEFHSITNGTVSSCPTGRQTDNGVIYISNYYGFDKYIYYYDIANDTRTLVVETGSHEISWCQVAKDGSDIIFGIQGDEENYLCKTNGMAEAATWDTLGTYPLNIQRCLLK
jgi:hypothetical protein